MALRTDRTQGYFDLKFKEAQNSLFLSSRTAIVFEVLLSRERPALICETSIFIIYCRPAQRGVAMAFRQTDRREYSPFWLGNKGLVQFRAMISFLDRHSPLRPINVGCRANAKA